MAGEKKIEKSIEINASAEDVWRAISEGEELKRWFPLDSRVTPGEGGKVWLSWGEGSEWESPIEVWKPGKQLGTVDTIPVEGKAPLRLAVDYIIESKGGTTVLRLVHSGFAADTWEDELETMGAGWAAFLVNLKHYLERHRGEPRAMAFVRHEPVPAPRPEVFRLTVAALGVRDAANLRVGDRFFAETRDGDRFEGTVRVAAQPINITATLDNWNEGSLMIEIEPGRERCRPAVWVSLYGSARPEAPALQERLRKLLQGAFAAPTER